MVVKVSWKLRFATILGNLMTMGLYVLISYTYPYIVMTPMIEIESATVINYLWLFLEALAMENWVRFTIAKYVTVMTWKHVTTKREEKIDWYFSFPISLMANSQTPNPNYFLCRPILSSCMIYNHLCRVNWIKELGPRKLITWLRKEKLT